MDDELSDCSESEPTGDLKLNFKVICSSTVAAIRCDRSRVGIQLTHPIGITYNVNLNITCLDIAVV